MPNEALAWVTIILTAMLTALSYAGRWYLRQVDAAQTRAEKATSEFMTYLRVQVEATAAERQEHARERDGWLKMLNTYTEVSRELREEMKRHNRKTEELIEAVIADKKV